MTGRVAPFLWVWKVLAGRRRGDVGVGEGGSGGCGRSIKAPTTPRGLERTRK